MHHPQRQNVTTSMVRLENGHIRKDLTPKMVNLRDIRKGLTPKMVSLRAIVGNAEGVEEETLLKQIKFDM